MKWTSGYRMKTVWLEVVVCLLLGGGVAEGDFVFGPPTNLGPPINTASNEATFYLSADGLELYLSSNRPGTYGIGDIWVSTRPTTDHDWTEPVNLGPIVNSPFPDTVEYISPDGLELYFDSLDRPGGKGGWDIWVSVRATKNDPWGEPENLETPLNTSDHDWKAYILPDNLKFYFTSMRPGGYGGADIWAACRVTTEDPWADVVNLGPLVNSPADDAGQNISADGLTFFFHSMRSGGYGALDLWMTTRRTMDDDWNIPVNLGPTLNTASDEIMPEISADGSMLYFCSSRLGGLGAWDIYQAPIIPIVDFNSDGKVDIDDLVILIEHWETDEPLCDIGPMPWGDGVVDRADVEVLMSYYGQEIDDPTLVAHWKLDEIEGDMALDSAGGNDALVTPDARWQPEGGMVGGALEFDGADDHVSTPSVLNPADGPFSVFAWVKGGAPGQVVVSQAGGDDWLMADPSAGKLMTTLQKPRGRSPVPPLVSEVVITDGQWHRVGLVWDGTDRILYVDDAEVARDAQAAPAGSTGGLYFGCGKEREAGTFFSGLIDDVRVHSRAVTP